MKLDIDVLKQDLEKIKALADKSEKNEEDLIEARRIFNTFVNFINENSKGFKRFKKSDREAYENITFWVERQVDMVREIDRYGFSKIIKGPEDEATWMTYEAWILGDLIEKYHK